MLYFTIENARGVQLQYSTVEFSRVEYTTVVQLQYSRVEFSRVEYSRLE